VVKNTDECSENDLGTPQETENARQSQYVQRQKPSLSNLQRLISPGSKDGAATLKVRKRAQIISSEKGESSQTPGAEEQKKKSIL
jgi:hypothetical protein